MQMSLRRPCAWRGRPATVARAAHGHWVGPRAAPAPPARVAACEAPSSAVLWSALFRPRAVHVLPSGTLAGQGASVCLLAGGGGAPTGPLHWAPMATGSAACAGRPGGGFSRSWRDDGVSCDLTIQAHLACPQDGASSLTACTAARELGDDDAWCAPLGTAHAPSPARLSLTLAAPSH